MSLHRFFLDGPLPAAAAAVDLPLSPGDIHHVRNVLRLQPGDRIVIVGADGRHAEATLAEGPADVVRADVGDAVAPPARPKVALAAGLARRERMELAIQKVTELGVTEIIPVATARSVVHLGAERAAKRTDRWRRIAEEAAKQSQRSDVPVVDDVIDVDTLLEDAGRFEVVLVPWEGADPRGLGIREALDDSGATAETSVLVVVGPEGGLEAAEVSALEEAGAVVVTLGDTVLRTETAAVVAVALAIHELGGLGGRAR